MLLTYLRCRQNKGLKAFDSILPKGWGGVEADFSCTMYTPSVYEKTKETAWKLRLSASAYLEDLVRGTPIYGNGISSTEVKEDVIVPPDLEVPIPEDVIELLERKQAEIDSIKAKKILMTKGNIRPDAEVIGQVMNQFGQIQSGIRPKKSWGGAK